MDASSSGEHLVDRDAPHDAQVPAERLTDAVATTIHLAVNALYAHTQTHNPRDKFTDHAFYKSNVLAVLRRRGLLLQTD